ncbi:hypothetical protein BerOc1_00499 [Pseudodesulfovibrio hydrargyri]|uniref:Uncharacterized protein n=1 Tax=Pseudodesulfovibrio hydrargyri TaxID=2125990 RepID=A0A1J5N1M5_9BACT|nr:hypothetical protein [Pseudodesulfovibrio hydrargyri]OIQ52028.1 hypothetical protein BerOc1_00499 [Pseudodesulfovibrio hydrargyri]
MCNRVPTSCDVQKIHEEINQLANQRFLLTTLSVTVFGLVLTMQLPKDIPVQGADIGGLHYMLSIISSIVIFFLYVLSHYTKGMQRICTSYLVVTKTSTWEMDWEEFRKRPHFGYTKPQTALFLLINGLIVMFPFVYAFICEQQLKPLGGMFTLILVGLALEVLMYLMGFKNVFDLHKGVKKTWEEIKIVENVQKDHRSGSTLLDH